MAKGYKAAQEFHENNTGMPYAPFKLPKSGDALEVRVLQHQDEWENLNIHAQHQKVKPTRCASDGAKDASKCALCAMDVPRSLKTYIPVRVRGDEDTERVQVIVYGREGLQEVINQIEELPEGVDITHYDFKVKRVGEKLDTKYKWFIQAETKSPLSEDERSLEVPDIGSLIAVPDELELVRRAKGFRDAESASATPIEAAGKTARPRF